MPIVGEAVVFVRVVSNRLAADIRKAVKDGLNDANADIDTEGEKVGSRLGDGVVKGVRKSRAKIGKEVVLSARNVTTDSQGIFASQGEGLGARFVTGIGDGVRSNESALRKQIEGSMVKAIGPGSGTDKAVGRELEGAMRRAITSGSGGGGIQKLGEEASQSFTDGMRGGIVKHIPDFQDDVRKSFKMRPGDIDDDGKTAGEAYGKGQERGFRSWFGRMRQAADDMAQNMAAGLGKGLRGGEKDMQNDFRRIFVGGIKGAAPDIDTAYGRLLGNSFSTGVRNAVRNTKDDWVEGAKKSATNFRNGLGMHKLAFQGIGREWAEFTNRGFGSGGIFGRAGEKAGDEISKGAKKGIRGGFGGGNGNDIGRVFSDFGKSMGKHFNLGIGGARMGSAIISIMATAGPGIIAAGVAIITSMITEIITLMSALGPGIAGAFGVGLAAVSSLVLSTGLLVAAFKAGNKEVAAASKRFGELGKELGKPIAAGMAAGFTSLVDSLYKVLPAINGVLRETGEAFGRVFEKIGKTVSSAENLARIQGILKTNVRFIDNFGSGLDGLVESFIILFNAAKPFVDYVGEGAKRFGEWASASLKVAEGNGALAAWMDGMLTSFKDLWAITKNFAQGFKDVFNASSTAGETMLGSIRGIAERFHAWTSDTGNMERMTAFFEKAHTLSSKIWELLGSMFTAGGRAFEGMNLDPLLHVLDTLQYVVMPAIARFFNQIQAGASENLVKAFDNIGIALTKIADNGSFQKVAEVISAVLLKITEFAASDFGSMILGVVLPIALMGGILTSLLGPLFALSKGVYLLYGAFLALSAPLALFIAIAAGVAAAFALLYANSQAFRDSISNLLTVIGGEFTAVWDKISPKLEAVWGKFQRLAEVIGDRLAPVIDFLTPIIARVIEFIGDLLGNAIDAVSGLIDVLIGIFTGDWALIWEGAKQIFSAAWQQILTVLGGVLSVFSIIWDTITAVVYNVGQVIWGIITSAWEGISSTFMSIVDGIASWFSEKWNALFADAEGVVTGIGASVSGAWDTVSSIFHEKVEAITSWFSDRWQNIYNVFEGIWNKSIAIVKAAWTIIWAVISGVFEIIWKGILVFGNLILQVALIPFRLIWEGIKAIWELIGPYLIGYWNSIVDFAASVWNRLVSVIGTVWDAISAAVQWVWGYISGFLSTVWNGIAATAAWIWGYIVGGFTTLWNGVVAIATGFGIVFMAIVSGIWNAVSAATQWVWGYISGFLSTVWNGILAIATTVWNAIINAIMFVVDHAVSWLSDRWQNIKNIAEGIWNNIKAVASAVWNGITGAIRVVVEAVSSWLSDRWQNIKNIAEGIWNNVKAVASAIWNGIVAAIRAVVDPIVGWLQEKWDAIRNGITSAWNALTGIVSNIWNGIKEAIIGPVRSAWEEVTKYVGWVGDLIGGILDVVSSAVNTVTGNTNSMLAEQATAQAAAANIAAARATAAMPGNAAVSILGLDGIAGGVQRMLMQHRIIPELALGGIISPTPGGSLFRLGEAGQRERVEPLDQAGLSARDRAMIKSIVASTIATMSGGGVQVDVRIGEHGLDNFVTSTVRRENSDLARRVGKVKR